MNLELLRRFVTVADEGNLTRAADELFVSQPVLSRQISRLEKEVGAHLFTRTPDGMVLTDAGVLMYKNAQDAIALIDKGMREAKEASLGETRVSIGYRFPTEVVNQLIRVAQSYSPEVIFDLIPFDYPDSSCGLRSGEADAAFLWLPIDLAVDYVEIYRGPCMAILSREHRLSNETTVSIENLIDDPLVTIKCNDQVFSDYANALAYRHGTAPKIVYEAKSTEEALQHISLNEGIGFALTLRSKFHTWESVVWIPISDVEDCTFVLAQRSGETNPALDSLFQAIEER
jgi:DNA-binding transcriptional LysR family regulator